MFVKPFLTAVLFATIPSVILAQGFSGGELTIDITSFSEGNNPNGVNYSGALEYAINRNFSVAGAVAVYDYSISGGNATNLELHGIYHLDDQSSIGAFIGNVSQNASDVTFFGLEGGFETGALALEGYGALYDNAENSAVFGLSGAYQINTNIAAIGDLGFAVVDDENLLRISAGAQYTFAGGPNIYAEIGNVSGDNTDSGFIGLGASLEFGAARGTTFDRRGILETISFGF